MTLRSTYYAADVRECGVKLDDILDVLNYNRKLVVYFFAILLLEYEFFISKSYV